jgi:hypothetical protein
MLKVVLAVLTVASFATAADAASKRKRQKLHHAPVVSMPAKPYATQTPGPPWAGPGECYTDEGYGRYWPCGAGRAE